MIYYRFLNPKTIYYFCEIDYVFKTEQWKDVPDYGGIYQISDLGRVKSLKCRKEKILKSAIGGRYLTIALHLNSTMKTYSVHYLVVNAFLNYKPSSRKMVIDHKDNDRLNNKLNNLQIISNRHNTSKDRFRNNYSSKYIGVTWSLKAKKWSSNIYVDSKLKHLGLFNTEEEASAMYQKALKELS